MGLKGAEGMARLGAVQITANAMVSVCSYRRHHVEKYRHVLGMISQPARPISAATLQRLGRTRGGMMVVLMDGGQQRTRQYVIKKDLIWRKSGSSAREPGCRGTGREGG